MPPHADAIARSVIATFNSLPSKFKPRVRPDGRPVWVPLAGIVLSKDNQSSPREPSEPSERTIECVTLATGMKCLPQEKARQANGNVLHDSHAEILAIRAFNRFLIDECYDLAKGVLGGGSRWVRWRGGHDVREEILEHAHQKNSLNMNGCGTNTEDDKIKTSKAGMEDGMHGETEAANQPFSLRDDVSIHMFCSEAPCGDSSMEITMQAQDDASPWEPRSAIHIERAGDIQGRGHFDRLGVIRRKPSRPDAPPTLSKSCSDKLALKQCTSLLSSITSRLMHPENAYLTSLVLPESQYVRTACERAFDPTGRMDSIAQKHWKGGYGFRPFTVQIVPDSKLDDYEFSKRAATSTAGHLSNINGNAAPVPSNLSALYIRDRHNECLINGLLEGRKFPDPRGASCISRRALWKRALSVATVMRSPPLDFLIGTKNLSYAEMKAANRQSSRVEVKKDVLEAALHGWKKNDGDEAWFLSDTDMKEIGGH